MRRYIWGLCVTLVVGCSSSEETQPEPVDFAAFGSALTEAQCETIFSCCDQPEVDTIFTGVEVASIEECREAVEGQTRVFVIPAIEDSVTNGRLRVVASEEQGCLAALRARSCSDFTPGVAVDLFRLDACRAFLEPVLETSEFCHEHYECKSGFCSLVSGEEEGTCKLPASEGQGCLNGTCADGYYCSEVDDTCRERLADGAECSRNDECASENCIEDAQAARVCGETPLFCEGGA